jgi:hypothetical protein
MMCCTFDLNSGASLAKFLASRFGVGGDVGWGNWVLRSDLTKQRLMGRNNSAFVSTCSYTFF